MFDSRLRVLVADDADQLRLMLRMHVEMLGHVVVGEAVDGIEAVELAAMHRPEVVLLDVSMPRLDGLGALPQLRAILPTSQLIVLTAHEEERYRDDALRGGADVVLDKTTAIERLPEVLRAAVA